MYIIYIYVYYIYRYIDICMYPYTPSCAVLRQAAPSSMRRRLKRTRVFWRNNANSAVGTCVAHDVSCRLCAMPAMQDACCTLCVYVDVQDMGVTVLRLSFARCQSHGARWESTGLSGGWHDDG